MIRHAKTGDVPTTDAACGNQEVLKVEVGEAVIPGGINRTCIDVLVVGVGESIVVTGCR